VRSSWVGNPVEQLNDESARCRACPRLVAWREQVARERRRAFADETYWGRAVPSFGTDNGPILIVGLAPAAHGANRTGRMFTGDRSADVLMTAMHRTGLASQPDSTHRNDGLTLLGCRVTAAVHCAPPGNRPDPDERARCQRFLEREVTLVDPRVIVALGAIAWDGVLRTLTALGHPQRPKPRFGHGAEVRIGQRWLVGAYHPSQQNTFTGRLTPAMLDAVLVRAIDRARAA
jgi:uracil-DNA glycosylase family 4